MLKKTVLFEARTGGYHNYRVPGILCTPGGVILATAEARRGVGGDWDQNDLLMRRSLDGGATWLPVQRLVSADDYGPGPLSNCVLIAGAAGDGARDSVHALFCHDYARVFAMRSEDGGATFSAPREITPALAGFRAHYPWRVIATGPGHGIRLRNGRLLTALWMSDGSGAEFPGHLGHRPSAVATIYSDDDGETWQRGDIVTRTDERTVNPSETVLAELDGAQSSGRVLANIRSESAHNRRLVSVSPDGAHGWSEPRTDDALLEPVCMAALLRLREPSPAGGGRYLFSNPDNLENELIPPGGHLAHDRKRLTVKLSEDNCESWTHSRVLEEGPSGYSDLAQAADGTILCLYECGMLERMSDTATLTLARFDLDWLAA